MSRITIFTLSDCCHCERVKAALTSRGVTFTEISLTVFPNKRVDMLSLCNQLTVPQVFFDDEHIGGATETIALLEKWQEEEQPNPIDRFRHGDDQSMKPIEPRLEVPNTPPIKPAPPLPRNKEETSVELPDGSRATALEVISTLLKIMPRADLPYHARVYRDCFRGRDGVIALMAYYELADAETAVQFGRRLQRARILDHVCGDHQFSNTDYYFRLNYFSQPRVLNNFMVWTERVDPDPMALLGRIKKLMSRIEFNALDEKTGLVDYVAAESDPLFLTFEEASCELQGVLLSTMKDERARLAFSINLYNLMIKHAMIKVGVGMTSFQRKAFYNSVCYNLGGDILSFNQLEHGIIRANTRPPYQLSTPFPKQDQRAHLAVSKLDHRVHFALNCGAKSCPPVRCFTPLALEEELRIVTEAFCEDEANVFMDEERSELHLSMIFNWYRADFAPSLSKLADVVIPYLRGERKDKLQRMLSSGRKIEVKFRPYDWNATAAKCKEFDRSKIENPNEVRLKAIFSQYNICATEADHGVTPSDTRLTVRSEVSFL